MDDRSLSQSAQDLVQEPDSSSPEYEALRKSYSRLLIVVPQVNVVASLFQKAIIGRDLLLQPTGLTSTEYAQKIMDKVLVSVNVNPERNFDIFCEALEVESAGKEIAAELKGARSQTQRILFSKDATDERAYHECKNQLEALHKIFQSAQTSKAKESAITLIKDQIEKFIEDLLSAGLVISKVESQLDDLCFKDAAVPSVLLEWVKAEFEYRIKQVTNRRAVCKESTCTELPRPEPVQLSLFDKDTLYHAGLCCEAVSTCQNMKDLRNFFCSKSPMHNFKEFSLSEKALVKPYLVIKEGRKIYVAFKSSTFISEFNKVGYDEAMKSQANQMPIRFFTELLWNNYNVVLTGFSFGGILACCVMARLWQESRISATVLLKQTTCIAFGVPFMSIPLIQQGLRVAPDLNKCIHSVFLKEDLFPQIMGYISLAASTLDTEEAKESKDSRQDAASSGLARRKRIKLITESLIYLQEEFFQKQKMYAKGMSPPLKPESNIIKYMKILKEEVIKAALDTTPESFVSLVHGTCYVMAESKSELVWNECSSTTPQILSLELTFETRVLAKKIETFQQPLFKKHVMEHYNQMILRSYLDKPEKYIQPSFNPQRNVKPMDMLIPSLKRAELHEYPREQVLVVEGENLWFSFKIILDEGGQYEYEMLNAHNVTKFSLQFNFPTSKNVSQAIRDGGKVKITLHTHFFTKVIDSVECNKKPLSLSVRQMQLARHTPSQVIKLAFLSTLLEQQKPESNRTKRHLKTICFLDEVLKVVPVESVVDAIAYARHDIAMECTKALKASKLTLQPTRLMMLGLHQSLFRGMYGISGEVFEDMVERTKYDPTPKEGYFVAMEHIVFGRIPGFPSAVVSTPSQTSAADVQLNSHHGSTYGPATESSLTSESTSGFSDTTSAHGFTHSHHNEDGSKYNRNETKSTSASPLYADVVTGKASSDVPSSLRPPSQSSSQQISPILPPVTLPTHIFSELNIFFGLDQNAYPEKIFFPDEIITFLLSCCKGLHERANILGFNLEIIGKTNLEEIYPASRTIRRNMILPSPRLVLAESVTKLKKFVDDAQMEVNFAKPKNTHSNKEMLKLINSIYNFDVALCAALIGAFMERRIEIPFLKSPELTAEALSSPMAVGVWALFSVSPSKLQEMLESSQNTELVIKVKEYMHTILSDESQDELDDEEKLYAGKLQFLLEGMHRTVTSSTKCISYSLEYQLCNNLKFDKDISLQELVSNWDRIFKDDILFHVAKSHRPLLARWIKWTILVHDLRETLAEYTCIGVTGLINSGKSLLVKRLFNLKRVQVGTLKSKQTTVPLLYNLGIDSLDVIDFPGMDDNDESVPELAQLMLTLSQIIVFVVDYRKISATAIKLWLDKMKSEEVPVLICLTHADYLYLECVEREKEYRMEDIDDKKKAIQYELQMYKEVIGNFPSWNVDFYSFAQAPTIRKEDLKAVGIKSHVDVGEWLVDTLKSKLDQRNLAENLLTLFSIRESSCNSQ